MPNGRSPRGSRRGAPPCHALSCRPMVSDPPWKITRTDFASMVLVFAVCWILYYNTLTADFAYDDSRAIQTNQDLLPTTPLLSIFGNDFWGTPLIHSGSHKSYRPICVLTFRLNYYLGGFDPWGYHLMNIILHGVVSVIFTRMASMVFVGQVIPTLISGLVFVAHPIHTEAVAGVVGRADVGACFFFLISLLTYIRYCEFRDETYESNPKRWFYLYGCIFLATLSMLTKEHGVTVLAVCAIYDILIHHKVKLVEFWGVATEDRFKGLREGLLYIGVTAVTVLGLRMHLMGSKPPDFAPADNPAADSNCFTTRTLTFLFLPAYNFWMLLFPRWLSFDWSMDSIPLLTTVYDYRNLFSLLFYGILTALTYWLVKTINKRGQLCDNVYSQSAYCAAMNAARLRRFPPSSESRLKEFLLSNAYTRRFGEYVYAKISIEIVKKPSPQLVTNNNNCSLLPVDGLKLANGNQQPSVSTGHHGHHTNPGQHSNHGHHASHGNHIGHGHHSSHAHHPNHGHGNGHISWKIPFVCQCTWTPFINEMEVVIFSLGLIILPFIPATNLFFYVGFVVAERVLYIPSMGFCLLIGLGVDNLYKRSKTTWSKRILVLSIVLLLSVMSARTVVRNIDWQTEENLYRSGIPINPPKAYGNLANILSGQGKKKEAEIAYKKALSYRANMADVRYNLGILLQEQSRYEEALYSYRLAIQYRPRLAMAYLNMGLVLGILDRKEEAAEIYRLCAELDNTGLKDPKMHESTQISALFNLGRLYADDNRYQDAINIYFEAIQKMPDYYQPQSLYNMLGEAYYKMGQFVDAERWYLAAMKAKPDHIPAHLTYAKLLFKWNRSREAEKWFIKAMHIAPNDSSVHQHYGQFLSETERHAEAAEIFLAASQWDGNDFEIVFNAANTLRQAGRSVEAESYYKRAVKLKPNEVTSHMNLGAMLHVNGKLLEAESSYLKALKLRPNDVTTLNNLQKLRNLMSHKDAIKAAKAAQAASREISETAGGSVRLDGNAVSGDNPESIKNAKKDGKNSASGNNAKLSNESVRSKSRGEAGNEDNDSGNNLASDVDFVKNTNLARDTNPEENAEEVKSAKLSIEG